LSRTILVLAAVSSINTSRAGLSVPCSRIQRLRARATSGRACSAARRLFFKGDVVPDEKPRQSAAASGDPLPAHRRNRFVQRQIRMLGDQRQQPARVLLQWRDASATRLRCRAAVIMPAPQPVDHRTRAHFKKPGHLVSRGATFDDRYRARPQVVRIWLGHPTILPKGIRGARLAHPQTFGNPPDSRPVGYALDAMFTCASLCKRGDGLRDRRGLDSYIESPL
jgi:hypothetical protein